MNRMTGNVNETLGSLRRMEEPHLSRNTMTGDFPGKVKCLGKIFWIDSEVVDENGDWKARAYPSFPHDREGRRLQITHKPNGRVEMSQDDYEWIYKLLTSR